VKRFGQVIGIDPSRIDEYERHHRNLWPEIGAALDAAGIRNYSIFVHGDQLFAYFEYHGPDDEYDARMNAVADAPRMAEWWALMGSIQRPDPNRAPGEFWTNLRPVFERP
jgi:L-rhamnose mutarotase